MKSLLICLLGLSLSIMACKHSGECKDEHMGQAPGSVDGVHYGDSISPEGAITYDELNKQMQGKDTLRAKLTGTVVEVCQMKGCWMTIASATDSLEPLFINFKDYAFAMPKDLSGKKVAMDGYAYFEETSVEDLKHYAEDAKKSKEEIDAITSPKMELKYEANGVVVMNN